MSNFQKLFQVKLNPEIFRFLTWNLEKVVKPINKSIKFPSVLEPPTLQNKSNSKGACLYLCEIILEVPFQVHAKNNSWKVRISILAYFEQNKYSFNFKAKIYIFHEEKKAIQELISTHRALHRCTIHRGLELLQWYMKREKTTQELKVHEKKKLVRN